MAEDKKRLEGQVSFDEFPLPTYDDWKEECVKLLKGAPFEKKMVSKTYEGLTLKAMYWADDAKGLEALNELPGFAPYTRGTKVDGYGEKGWFVAQGAESSDLTRAHAQLVDELSRGAEMAYVKVDEMTRRMSREVGHLCPRSLNLSTLQRVEGLLEGVDGATPLCLETGAENFGLYAALCARAKKCGAPLKGIVAADPLGELARWGQLDDDLSKIYDRLAQVIAHADGGELRTLLVDTTVYEQAGAHALTQLAAAVATGIEYINALTERGLTVSQVCRALVFKVALGADFFMQIGKLRALRRLWATAVQAYGGTEEDAKAMIFAETSAFTLTTYDPYVNLLRSSTQTFSGVVGGIDALHILPFDAALRESTDQARRIARNQQIMFKTEFDMMTPVDPAGGSWFVERLTEELAQGAWSLLGAWEEEGGILPQLTSGALQEQVEETLKARFAALATRKDKAVGVNMYANMTEEPLQPAYPFDEKALASELKALVAAPETLTLKDLVADSQKALEGGATLADLSDALGRKPWGQVKALTPHRWTEEFEALRNRTRAHLAAGGENVKVFLANMGPVPQHKPRADFTRGFFEVGEFEVIGNEGFGTVEEAAQAALASGAGVVVICSTDATYPEIVPPLARALKSARPALKVVLAGAPAPDMKGEYLESGVDEFIHVKADCLTLLRRLQDERGMAQ